MFGNCFCFLLLGIFFGLIFELTLIVGSAGLLGPPFHRCVGLKAIECGLAAEIYSLGFLQIYLLEKDNFLGVSEFPKAVLS